MGVSDMNKLDEMQLSVLTEIGNIGSGNAATALATLLNTFVDIEIPNIHLIDFEDVSQYLGGPDNFALGLTITLDGDIQGMMLQIIQKEFAEKLINTFYEKEISSLHDITEMDLSVVREMGNITTAAYINSIAKMTNTFINITPPQDHIDTVGNILSIPSNSFASLGKKVLFIDESFCISGTQIKGSMILILEYSSMNTLFQKLGLPV
ncbi:MAG: chemotaxis protein CheC [Lachnospiraceae bacterium]|nr:chemotaxis protein CheC [Lachnospiraceae bacterium]